MAFTQQSLNYTTEYSAAMANAYPYWSYFADLYGSPNSATYRPLKGNAVAVQSMSVSGARFVDRDNLDGQFTRNFNTQEQILAMRMYREWDTLVDPMDIQEDAIVTIANITQTYNQFQKVPEMDAYAAEQLAAAATEFGSVDATALITNSFCFFLSSLGAVICFTTISSFGLITAYHTWLSFGTGLFGSILPS